MNNQKWTAEPWKAFNNSVVGQVTSESWIGSEPCRIADTYGDNDTEAEANAKRIVDCVNACKGIQDPVTAIPTMVEALRMALMELIKPCQKQKTIELIEKALKQAGVL